MKTKLLLLLVLGSFTIGASAQNIKDQKVTYSYIQLPSKPFKSGTEEFSVTVTQDFDQRNEDSVVWYEARLAKVREERNAAMKIWNDSKGDIDKAYYAAMSNHEQQVALGSTTSIKPPNPVYGSCPCTPDPSEPFKTSDIPTSAIEEMVQIPMMTRSENGAKITIGFQGFDKGPIKESKSSTGEYTYSISYRHPIHVKIEDKDGSVIIDKLLPGSTGYTAKSTQKFKTSYDFKIWWMDNEETFWAQRQKDVINKVISNLNNMLAEDIGFPTRTRKIEIYTAKDKNHDYSDVLQAYQSLQDGLLQLSSDRDKDAAIEYLGTAVSQYQAILGQSDTRDKKARVNKKVTAAMYCNIAECFMWMDDYSQAELHLNKAANLGIGKYKRHGNNMKPFLHKQKKRFGANQ